MMKGFTDFILSVFFYTTSFCQIQNNSSGTVFDKKTYWAYNPSKFYYFAGIGYKIIQIPAVKIFISFHEGLFACARFSNAYLSLWFNKIRTEYSFLPLPNTKLIKHKLYSNPTFSMLTFECPDVNQENIYEKQEIYLPVLKFTDQKNY